MIVQHQLEVYIENPCQFLCQLSKKSGARDRVQPTLRGARNEHKGVCALKMPVMIL